MPGPSGAAQLAVVHGGEAIFNQQQQASLYSRLRAAPPTININNNRGDDTDIDVQSSIGPSGEQVIDVMVNRSLSRQVGTGQLDPFISGIGGRRRLIRR